MEAACELGKRVRRLSRLSPTRGRGGDTLGRLEVRGSSEIHITGTNRKGNWGQSLK